MVTSVFSGLAIGLLGMGWTLVIAIVLTVAALVHLLFIRIPEDAPEVDAEKPARSIDLRGSIRAVAAVLRAVRADPLLDPEQPHRRRLHGAHGPLRAHAVPGRVVGRGPRHHGDRLHHRRRRRREVRSRPQPDPHDAALRHRDGRRSAACSRSESGGGSTRSGSGSTCASSRWSRHPSRPSSRRSCRTGRRAASSGSRRRSRRRRPRSRRSSSHRSRSSGSSRT